MSLTNAEVAHLLIALTLLVVVAHALGHLFAAMRQPPVVGEILGGLLLGPTVLGSVDASAPTWLYPRSGPTASSSPSRETRSSASRVATRDSSRRGSSRS